MKHEGNSLDEKFSIAGSKIEGPHARGLRAASRSRGPPPADSQKENGELGLTTSRKCFPPTTCELGKDPGSR